MQAGTKLRTVASIALVTAAAAVFFHACSGRDREPVESMRMGSDQADDAARAIPASREVPPPERAARCWQRMRATGGEASPTTKQEVADYWMAVLFESHDILWKYIFSEGVAGVDIRYIVSRFGQDGPQADFRLLFCDPALMMPFVAMQNWDYLKKEQHGISMGEYHELRGRVNRCFVELFCDDHALLKRYARAALWFGAPRARLASSVGALVDDAPPSLKTDDDATYWWYARNFLVCAAVTGKLDWLQDVNPRKLGEAFDRWKAWYDNVEKDLVFDPQHLIWRPDPDSAPTVGYDRRFVAVPKEPFLDWEGPPPPRSSLIVTYRQMAVPELTHGP